MSNATKALSAMNATNAMNTTNPTNANLASILMATLATILDTAIDTLVSPRPEQILELEGSVARGHLLAEAARALRPARLYPNEVAALRARHRSLGYLLDYTAAHLATIKRLSRPRTLPGPIFSSSSCSAGRPDAVNRVRSSGGLNRLPEQHCPNSTHPAY